MNGETASIAGEWDAPATIPLIFIRCFWYSSLLQERNDEYPRPYPQV
jgi:hypothetical protein